MDSVLWFSFLTYTVTTSITPGPNNILVLNAVGNFGVKRSRPLLAGICSGVCCVMALCGIFSVSLARQLPSMLPAMKYIGCGYILWLAYRVLKSKAPADGRYDTGPQLSFPQGFFLQFANVKSILYGVTVFTAYILPYYSTSAAVVVFTELIVVICIASLSVWAAAGSLLSRLMRKYSKAVNAVMALALAYSAVSLATMV